MRVKSNHGNCRAQLLDYGSNCCESLIVKHNNLLNEALRFREILNLRDQNFCLIEKPRKASGGKSVPCGGNTASVVQVSSEQTHQDIRFLMGFVDY